MISEWVEHSRDEKRGEQKSKGCSEEKYIHIYVYIYIWHTEMNGKIFC
jgi:hypothetical protein